MNTASFHANMRDFIPLLIVVAVSFSPSYAAAQEDPYTSRTIRSKECNSKTNSDFFRNQLEPSETSVSKAKIGELVEHDAVIALNASVQCKSGGKEAPRPDVTRVKTSKF